jgi:hypothetical protein
MTFNIFSRWFTQNPARRRPALRRRPYRPGVEALEGRQLLSTWTVTTTLDNGSNTSPTPGSLRQAILHADNLGAAGDKIVFAIPTNDPGYNNTTGAFTIQPPTSLPAVSTPVTIDGYTQPGAAPNTAGAFDNAHLKIVLDGGFLPSGNNGLNITAGGTTVKGLVIENFLGLGVYLTNAGGDTVAGNFIGTDVSGKLREADTNGCIYAFNGGFNTIGGPALGDRNLISGGGLLDGIDLYSDGNVVQNNFIGTDASAVADLPDYDGIKVLGSNNLIGGALPGAGNLIAGNFNDGIAITQGSSAFNEVEGNQITFNNGNGVAIYNGAHDNVIGLPFASAPVNDISSNKLDGVHFDNGTANVVTGSNTISANGGLGIQLLNNANNNQPPALLTSATVAGGQTTITGTLISTANTTFTINFWDNPSSDPAEGHVFLGSLVLTTNAYGSAPFTATFTTALAAGDSVTATATGGSGTSAFSPPVTVTVQPPDVTPLVSIQRGKLRHKGGRYRQTITLHNSGAPLQGPLYLVVDQLTPKVHLRFSAGQTQHAAPLGSPYMLVSLNNNQLGTGETRTLLLTFANPLRQKIHYNLRVLDGATVP